jgi:hypothetical protein
MINGKCNLCDTEGLVGQFDLAEFFEICRHDGEPRTGVVIQSVWICETCRNDRPRRCPEDIYQRAEETSEYLEMLDYYGA